MRIGLTYDLRDDYLALGYGEEETAEFDHPDTIGGIEDALHRLGHTTERIGHVRALAGRLVSGQRWDLVFNIAEGLKGVAREAQVPALLEAYGVPYTFSDPLVLALTLHKGMTKRVLRDGGVPTADFAEVACAADIDRVDLPYPLFVKPVAEGTGKGVDGRSLVRDAASLRERCLDLLARFEQPVLVERYLPGREFTVGITGTGAASRIVGTTEILLLAGAEAGAYTLLNKEDWKGRVTYRRGDPLDDATVAEAEAVALAAWRLLGCRDGGRLDLRCDEHGRVHLIELNPLAGLRPDYSDLALIARAEGLSYDELIARVIASASARVTASGTAFMELERVRRDPA
jgi:D-alanine-D-alanine ligase